MYGNVIHLGLPDVLYCENEIKPVLMVLMNSWCIKVNSAHRWVWTTTGHLLAVGGFSAIHPLGQDIKVTRSSVMKCQTKLKFKQSDIW